VARRQRILDSARELLREDPTGPLTTRRIAERAKVAPGTVYNLLGPRHKLWEAFLDAFMEELRPRLAADRPRDPIAHAHAIVRTTVELFVEDPVVSRRMLREWESSHLMIDPSPQDRLVEALTKARGQGVLRADIDVHALAAVVGGGCIGALHLWAEGQIDDDRFRDQTQLTLGVAIAAAAADGHRVRLLGPLRARIKRARWRAA
jgi:AcrR family transcriptional regulator